MQRLALGVLLAAVVGLLIAVAWHDRGMAVDDAYITFRFADNLRAGHGLRWNPESPPCEGYSNLSYVLGIAGLRELGLEPVPAALLLASCSVLALAWLLWRAAAPATGWAVLALVPAVWLFAADEMRIHASRGLETCLFATLCAAQAAAAARLCRPERPGIVAASTVGMCGIGLFLTRPDGVLMTATCLVGLAWLLRGDRERQRSLAVAVATWLVGGAIYALVKWRVFGYLLPNPFYMKSGGAGFAGIEETRAFVLQHSLLLGGLLVAAILRAPDWLAPRRARERRGWTDPTTFLCLVMVLPWLAYATKIVHEIGFAHRFIWPATALMALGAARGVAELVGKVTRGARTWPIAWLLLAGAVIPVWPTLQRHVGDLNSAPPEDPYTAMFLRLGRAIAATGIAPQLMLYCTHAGATPYASGAHHVDRAGLVDDGYCPRTPQAERLAYEARILGEIDIVSWHLFPASPGATAFDDDPRARASRYLNEWCLGLPANMDVAMRQGLARQDLAQRKDELHTYMRVLRDAGTLVGEMRTGLPRWRTFVYVWKSSPHHDRLVEHLSRAVDIRAAEVDYDGWPK